ncbi:MAG: hypothetical protein HFE63_10805 [Clostridiales bacterium]|nr:hypothetical protein [Clostridiales bacterium]
MIAICREVDKYSGAISVYSINADVTDCLLLKLSIRESVNPELRYYVITKERWDADKDAVVRLLKRKNITETALKRFGEIVQI